MLRHTARQALGRPVRLLQQGRGSIVLPDDRWLVSYPKSGNTWLRFMLAELLHPDATVDFGTIDGLVPELYGVPSWRQLRVPRPRLLKSHETFDHRYGSTIYLVRDPRDVCISLFHYSRKRELVPDDADLGDFVEGFTTRPDWAFGRWDEHVGSWLGAVGGSPRFLLVRYEDCIAEPHTQIARAAAHLGLAADEERIAEIVATYAIDEMRKLEASSLTAASPLAPRSRTDIPFVRQGTVGQWRAALAPTQAAAIVERFAPSMERVGYLDGA